MKIELELDDFRYLLRDDFYEGEQATPQIITDAFIDKLANLIADNLIYDHTNDRDLGRITEEAINIKVKENKDYIINRVIESVTSSILRSRAIVDQMPRKSEVANISKEWEEYFVGLVDKAIAKRFKAN